MHCQRTRGSLIPCRSRHNDILGRSQALPQRLFVFLDAWSRKTAWTMSRSFKATFPYARSGLPRLSSIMDNPGRVLGHVCLESQAGLEISSPLVGRSRLPAHVKPAALARVGSGISSEARCQRLAVQSIPSLRSKITSLVATCLLIPKATSLSPMSPETGGATRMPQARPASVGRCRCPL